MVLHHDVLADAAPGARVLVMLHGILGQGNNLRGIARAFIASGGWTAVLMDLRAHGQSQGAPGNADTVANCARDVEETLRSLGLEADSIVGHSYGGKVALATNTSARHIMTLDSAPGARPDARGSESTEEVILMLHRLKGPWPTRDAFVDEVMAAGQPKHLAQWLAMNVERRDDGAFHSRFDMKRIDALILDYLNVDLWSAVERKDRLTHLVVAERSRVYDHDDRVRAQTLETTGANTTLDLLEGTHWIHVDNPNGVVDVMRRRLT